MTTLNCWQWSERARTAALFRCAKRDSGNVYALKVLNKEGLLHSNQVQSTKAERRVLEVVNHPFIVKLHFAFQTHDKLCLVLDFVNGGELFSYIAKEKVR